MIQAYNSQVKYKILHGSHRTPNSMGNTLIINFLTDAPTGKKGCNFTTSQPSSWHT